MPIFSCSTLASGARQLVVQEAFEMMVSVDLILSSLTPNTKVPSTSVPGAEMITFFAPAARCAAALSRLVNRPVDSITTSTPSSFHGSFDGSRSAHTLMWSPLITRRSEEHTSELQSHVNLVCRLLLEKKKKN